VARSSGRGTEDGEAGMRGGGPEREKSGGGNGNGNGNEGEADAGADRSRKAEMKQAEMKIAGVRDKGEPQL